MFVRFDHLDTTRQRVSLPQTIMSTSNTAAVTTSKDTEMQQQQPESTALPQLNALEVSRLSQIWALSSYWVFRRQYDDEFEEFAAEGPLWGLV